MTSSAAPAFEPFIGENGEFHISAGYDRLSDILNNKTRPIVLDMPARFYEELSGGDKKALIHLIKAARILDRVFLKQDHPDNVRAKEAFEGAVAGGNELAKQAYGLFTIFNGLQGRNMYARKSEPFPLFEDKRLSPGKGFYPQDLAKEELVEYVLAHPEQASAIFSNNTVVVREEGRLKAVPYSVMFREEMEGAARELLLAAQATGHDGFAQYLRWQAQALVNDSDAEAVYNADKAWIGLEDSPLEFTIGRESYDDELSGETATDPRVKEMLETYGIKAKSKDTIGVRVGIVNRQSYSAIATFRKELDGMAVLMPFSEEYNDPGRAGDDTVMTFADVDLVAVSGDYAAFRTGITIAQNLPNSDKLAVQLGGGRRLVFHRQVRNSGDPEYMGRFLDALVEPAQHAWYDKDADFLFTVGHELAHSLGPRATRDGRDKKGSLGKWGDILEENKADIAALVMTDYMAAIGVFDALQANKIYLTSAMENLQAKQPSENEAHRFRSVMQCNYFREGGAVELETGGRLRIDPDLMPVVARQMLGEVIQLQLEGNAEKAEAFCRRYGAWNDVMQYAADQIMGLNPKLYLSVQQPMAERLLKYDI